MYGRAILGTVNPLRRSADRCRLYLRAIVLAMLGALVVAGNANAEAPGAGGGTPPSAEAAPEGASAGGGTPPSAEAAPEGTPPVSGEHPAEEAPKGPPVGGEPAPEAPKGAPSAPGGEQAPEEAPKVTPPVVVEPPHEEAPNGATSGTGAERPSEGALSTPAGERSSDGAPAGSLSSPTPPPVVLETPSTPQAAVTSDQSVREAPLALTVSLTGPLAGGGPGAGGPPTPDTGAASARTAGMIAARRLGELGCELSAPGGRTTHGCAAGWMVGPPVPSGSTVGFATAASLAAAATGDSPTGGGRGGSGMGNAPVSPAPGPAPSGASGSMTGGSGTAPLTLLTLAGLLLLAAPRAMRRLRLSSRPWLTACFVLIPERPG